MKEKCAKCKSETDPTRCIVSGGKSFVLCNDCHSFLEDHPNIPVMDYLGPKFETWVSKNIQAAHKARKERKSPWPSTN